MPIHNYFFFGDKIKINDNNNNENNKGNKNRNNSYGANKNNNQKFVNNPLIKSTNIVLRKPDDKKDYIFY